MIISKYKHTLSRRIAKSFTFGSDLSSDSFDSGCGDFSTIVRGVGFDGRSLIGLSEIRVEDGTRNCRGASF